MKEIDATEIVNGDMLIGVSANKGIKVNINTEELRKAKWVNVNEELPKEEGIYFILTNEHLAQGIATYFKDEDTGKMDFDVWWAVSGKEPKAEYWLKDNHWGLVYQFKKELGEIK